jgi:hypothetical protein
MSLLAHNRHGVPVIQPQVLAAIEAGLADKGKQKKNVKRNAVEKSLIRFKSVAQQCGHAVAGRGCASLILNHVCLILLDVPSVT